MADDKTKEQLIEQVTSLEAEVRDLQKNLIHDDLTSLKTKVFFEEESNSYLSAISASNVNQSKRKDWFGFKNLSLLFFDIDHFKKINDTFGHDVGDIVLRDVAGIIAKSVRGGDIVARWGGEEMVVSLLGANEEDAKIKAEEIRKSVEDFTFTTHPDVKVTISVGVAANFEGATSKDMLKNADLALYKAKRDGRNRAVAFSELSK